MLWLSRKEMAWLSRSAAPLFLKNSAPFKMLYFFRYFEYFEQICHIYIWQFLIWNVPLSQQPFSKILSGTIFLSSPAFLEDCPSLSTFSVAEILRGLWFIHLRLAICWSAALNPSFSLKTWFWEALTWLPAKTWISCSQGACAYLCVYASQLLSALSNSSWIW